MTGTHALQMGNILFHNVENHARIAFVCWRHKKQMDNV